MARDLGLKNGAKKLPKGATSAPANAKLLSSGERAPWLKAGGKKAPVVVKSKTVTKL